MMKRWSFPLTIATLLFAAQSSFGMGCYFGREPNTLTAEARAADAVFICYVEQNVLSDGKKGMSVLHVTDVIKDELHWLFDKRLTIDRYIDIPSYKPPQSYLIFAEQFAGTLDVYRGIPISSPEVAMKYLRQSLEIDPKNIAKRLAFRVDYLLAPDDEIAKDAFLELDGALADELISAGKSLDAQKLRGIIPDPRLNSRCLGRLGLLLAGCGNKDDVVLIRKILDGTLHPGSVDDRSAGAFRRDAPLIAYTVLSPIEGFQEIHSTVADPKREFSDRFPAFRALRHLSRHPVDPIDRASVMNAMALMIDQEDFADLAVEELRRLGNWDFTARAIEMAKKSTVPIIRRAVIRYALTAPKTDRLAREFIAEVRVKDPDRLADIIESIRLEQQPGKRPE